MRLIRSVLLAACLVSLASCDSSEPATPFELLTAGRWNDAGFEVLGSPGQAPDGFEVPEWWEFNADGTAQTQLAGEVRDPVPYVLSEDGSTITVQGVLPLDVETLTETDLVMVYGAEFFGFDVRVRLERDR